MVGYNKADAHEILGLTTKGDRVVKNIVLHSSVSQLQFSKKVAIIGSAHVPH